MRTKHTFRLPADLMTKLTDYAARKGVTQSLVLEAALASHLSPDGADRLEAALARRLDRMTRQMERIERHVEIANEALAVFVRFWLTSTPPLPDAALPAAKPRAVSATKDTSRRLAGVSPVGASSLTRSSEMLVEMRGSEIQAAARPDLRERHPCRL